MTNLRQLGEYFRLELPPSHSATVGGVVQECLQRLPQKDDECNWGPFQFHVIETPEEGQMLVHVRRISGEETS